jgi:hypothetical protein
MPLLAALKQRARRLKAGAFVLYLAARHPGTPWYAKLFMVGVVAYAFSPIDLIPDFVPGLGGMLACGCRLGFTIACYFFFPCRTSMNASIRVSIWLSENLRSSVISASSISDGIPFCCSTMRWISYCPRE